MNSQYHASHFQKFMSFVGAFVVLALTVFMLKVGANVFLPLVVAIVVWYILITMANIYGEITIKGKNIPNALRLVLSITTFAFALWIVVMIINNNVQSLLNTLPVYQSKLYELVFDLAFTFGVSDASVNSMMPEIDFEATFRRLAGAVGTIASLSGTVLVYVIFLLLEYRKFGQKLEYVFTNREQLHNVEKILAQINKDTQTYIGIQTLASLATGICVYIVLKLFEIEFAEFWGLLTFILNYIPVIGSVIATILPIMFALVQLDSFLPVIILAICIGSIQFLIGNILLPRFMGSSLNLSPLTILLSLAIWGNIWGTVGMFLSVPIMVIINIILARFNSTRWIAALLSGNGKVG